MEKMGEKCGEQALIIGKFQVPMQGLQPNAFELASAKPEYGKVQTRLCTLSKPNHKQGRGTRQGTKALGQRTCT